ncbi:hypothetical protein BH18ACT5_BH18ACT5_01980 [soil metagenome]
MKRAVLLGITTVLWVVAIQVIAGNMQPSREVDLTATNLAISNPRPQTALFGSGVGIALEASLQSFLDRIGRSPASTWSVEDIPLPSVLTTTTQGNPTTASTSTTTATPVTTAAPVTTAPPATTTTAAPAATAPVTTAPPATTAPPTTPPPATTAPPITAAPAGSFNGNAEADFIGRINGLRGSVSAAALAPNGELNNYARWWARHMADTNNFAHSDIGSLLNPLTIIGENIAAGGTVAAMFNGLVNSSGHYNNMVETRFTSVGVGVWVDASGRLWTCHVFAG